MTNLLTLCLAIVGVILCISLFALNDFDFEKTMFVQEEDDEIN